VTKVKARRKKDQQMHPEDIRNTAKQCPISWDYSVFPDAFSRLRHHMPQVSTSSVPQRKMWMHVERVITLQWRPSPHFYKQGLMLPGYIWKRLILHVTHAKWEKTV